MSLTAAMTDGTERVAASLLERPRVLIVEDNPGDTELVVAILDRYFSTTLEIVAVERLEPAIRRLREEPFSVVLLDLHLPDSQGLTTYTRTQRAAEETPIVILSGLTDVEVAAQAVRLGAQDCLSKNGLSGDQLVRALRFAVERRRLLDRAQASSYVDEATGLYNRRGLQHLGGPLIKDARRRKLPAAVLHIQVQGLERIGEEVGREARDRALQATVRIIRETLGEAALVARVGDDRFAALVTGVGPGGARAIVTRLKASFDHWNDNTAPTLALTANVGVAHVSLKL